MTDNTTDQQSTQQADKTANPEVARIEADLEQTRERLAETVDALGAKLDVKTRTTAKVTELREDVKARTTQLSQDVKARTTQLSQDTKVRATQLSEDTKVRTTQLREERSTEIAAAAGTIVALLVVLVVWRRRG